MRIQIASDLHLEHIEWRFPDFRGVEPAAADVLVLAGDIASGSRAFDLFAQWPCPVVYVPGNHEYYGAAITDVQAESERRSGGFPGLHVLAPGTCEVAGVRFIGCTLWTDYDLFGESNRDLAMTACAAMLPDHRIISLDGGTPFPPSAARQLHQAERRWLQAELASPFAGPTVVVTHHAPARGSLHPAYASNPVSAGFVSDLGDLLGKACLHVHGHTHNSFDYAVGTTRVVSNPMGYNKGIKTAPSAAELQRENTAFDPRLVVEI